MRRNRSQTATRRSHHALTGVRTARCECGSVRLPHRACPECGTYAGKVVIDVVARERRAQRRRARKETSLKESGRVAENEQREEEKARS